MRPILALLSRYCFFYQNLPRRLAFMEEELPVQLRIRRPHNTSIEPILQSTSTYGYIQVFTSVNATQHEILFTKRTGYADCTDPSQLKVPPSYFITDIRHDLLLQAVKWNNGAPSQPNYITIIAIHGMCFCAPIFKRAQAAALGKGVRFVAINRRNYPGSTAFTPQEIHALSQGTGGQKSDFLKDRAHEIATFIDKFIQKNHLPPISSDGKSGGIILLGWSLGCPEAIATIAHADSLSSHVRLRLASHLRALVIYEAGAGGLGKPNPPKDWSPYVEESIPQELRGHAFAQWVTAYFDHGDLSARDPDVLSYILPSTSRPGTMYNMTKLEQEEVIRLGHESAWEVTFLTQFGEQLLAVYYKGVFGDTTAQLFPGLKISHLAGEKAPSFAIAGFWVMQKDAEERGKTSIVFKLVPGMNHFVHWDEPEAAIDIFLECAGIVG